MGAKALVIFLIDKREGEFQQVGKCLVSLEMFLQKIEEKFPEDEEWFKRQYFMVFDAQQTPIGQIDISLSLV